LKDDFQSFIFCLTHGLLPGFQLASLSAAFSRMNTVPYGNFRVGPKAAHFAPRTAENNTD
jgi:hypothetical protein